MCALAPPRSPTTLRADRSAPAHSRRAARPAARPEMHAYYVHVSACIEHGIPRLRAMHDSAVECHADMIARARKHLQVVAGDIERKIDTARRQRPSAAYDRRRGHARTRTGR